MTGKRIEILSMTRHLPASAAAFGFFSHDFCAQETQLFANARNVRNVRDRTTSTSDATSVSIESSAVRNKGLFRPLLPPSGIHVSTSVDAALICQIAKDIDQFRKDGAS
jgi:hypothetical protein